MVLKKFLKIQNLIKKNPMFENSVNTGISKNL